MGANDTSRLRTSMQVDGEDKKVGATTTVKVLLQDENEKVLFCYGTTVPNAEAGYAKGCLFIKTDAGAGVKGVYENQGTTSSCSFDVIGSIAEAEIASNAVVTAKIANLAVTGAKIADGAITVAKIANALIKYTDVEITAQELKALRATPKELVPATEAGAGNAIIPFAVAIRCEAGAEVFTEDADNLSVMYSGGAEVIGIETTGLIDQLTDQSRYQEKAEAVMTPVANTAIVLKNGGDGEFGGNASNDGKLYVRTFYRVIPVL